MLSALIAALVVGRALPISVPVTAAPYDRAPRMTPKRIFAAYDASVVSIEGDLADGTSSGTGFFLGRGDLVATCYHVIEGAHKLRVKGTKGARWTVSTVYQNQSTDAAVLRLTANSGRRPIPIGSYAALRPGDEVTVIGNPLGILDHSLSTGIVSARRRSGTVNLLQMTAAISPGSSGGPVFNASGQVVAYVQSEFVGGQSLNIAHSIEELRAVQKQPPLSATEFYRRSVVLDDLRRNLAEPIGPADRASVVKASEQVARYERMLGEAIGGWEVWWRCLMDDKPTISEKEFSTLDRYHLAAMTAIDPSSIFAPGEGFIWSRTDLDAFEARVRALRPRLERLHSLQGTTLNEMRARTPEIGVSDSRAREEMASVNGLFRSLAFTIEGVPWLDHSAYEASASSPVSAAWIAVLPLDGVLPDPARPNDLYIGWAKPELRRLRGARISGYRDPRQNFWTVPKTWGEIDYTRLEMRGFDTSRIELRLRTERDESSIVLGLVSPSTRRR